MRPVIGRRDRKNMANAKLEIVGATNFRSLGGLPGCGGRHIRANALMRADRLVVLTAKDWDSLAGAGLATICDLRSAAERAEHPNRVPDALEVQQLNCEVSNDLRADTSLGQLMLDDPTARGAACVMIEMILVACRCSFTPPPHRRSTRTDSWWPARPPGTPS